MIKYAKYGSFFCLLVMTYTITASEKQTFESSSSNLGSSHRYENENNKRRYDNSEEELDNKRKFKWDEERDEHIHRALIATVHFNETNDARYRQDTRKRAHADFIEHSNIALQMMQIQLNNQKIQLNQQQIKLNELEIELKTKELQKNRK